MSIYSGSITNLIALDGSPTATIYVQKGDYYPDCSVLLCSWKGDTASWPAGQGANRIDLLRFAKHTLHLIAPPTTGVNIGYLPAGTYTLHQDRVPDGYTAAPDQKITIKDSAQFSDFQKITVVNQKQPVEHQHTYSDKWSWDDNNHWHAATCEHTDLVSDKGAHTLTDWVVIQQPTTESNGIKECHCTVCKYTLTQVIDKLPTIIPGLPLGPSQTIIPGLPLGPSQTIIPGLPLEPSQTIIPGLPLEPSQTVTPAEPETVAPPTGDTSPMALWAAVATLSCAGLAGVGIVYKKKQHQV